MDGSSIFAAHCLLGISVAVLGVFLLQWTAPLRWTSRGFDRVLLVAFALSRLTVFGVAFGLLNLDVRGDVKYYYVPAALHRLAGELPYRDFSSSYAPLYSFLTAALYRLHPSPVTLVLFALLCELAALPLWIRLSRSAFSESVVRSAALLYVCSPISVQFVTIDGQNNALLSLLIAGSLLLLWRGRGFVAGCVYGIGLAAVKFLPLIWLPVIVLTARRRWTWLVGCFVVCAGVYGWFALRLHVPVLRPFQDEGALKTAGGVPFLIEAVTGVDWFRPWDGLLLLCLACACVAVAWSSFGERGPSERPKQRSQLAGLCFFLITVQALGKKTWPEYLVLCLFPLLCVLAESLGEVTRKWRIAATVVFLCFSVVCVTEQSFWAQFLFHAQAVDLHPLLIQGERNASIQMAFETALLLSYATLLCLTGRVLLRRQRQGVEAVDAGE